MYVSIWPSSMKIHINTLKSHMIEVEWLSFLFYIICSGIRCKSIIIQLSAGQSPSVNMQNTSRHCETVNKYKAESEISLSKFVSRLIQVGQDRPKANVEHWNWLMMSLHLIECHFNNDSKIRSNYVMLTWRQIWEWGTRISS